MLLSFAQAFTGKTFNTCTKCEAENLHECRTCHTLSCKHRACPCPWSKRDLLEDQLWEAEDEVWQLNESEKTASLTEWQLGRRKMLHGKIEKLSNQLRIL